jgi:lipoyl synthase
MNQQKALKPVIRKPEWLKRRLPTGPAYEQVRDLLARDRLHTVCQEAHCPNIWECFSRGTATFLIMGPECTRACRFCAVRHGRPAPIDPDEPLHVAEAAREMGLAYIVVTSVTRDDLPDGGAKMFAKTIGDIHQELPRAAVEVLIPDFQGKRDALSMVMRAGPAVLNHNIETVPRLYPLVRPGAQYDRSLKILKWAQEEDPSIPVKSGLMLGLGESDRELLGTLCDLLEAGCRIVTLGQYLQPSKDHVPVGRFVRPEEFESWREQALHMGFWAVASGPFVRSSYQAETLWREALGRREDPGHMNRTEGHADRRRRRFGARLPRFLS